MYVVLCLIVFGCQYQCNWLPWKTRLRNDLLCVEWDVKPYTLTHSLTNPSTNRACRRVTSFIDTNELPLSQTAKHLMPMLELEARPKRNDQEQDQDVVKTLRLRPKPRHKELKDQDHWCKTKTKTAVCQITRPKTRWNSTGFRRRLCQSSVCCDLDLWSN